MRYEQLGVGVLNVDNIIGPGAQTEMGIGQKWYADYTNGSNGNSGKTAGTSLKTVNAGYSAMVETQNDTLFCLPGTPSVLSEDLTWAKDFTHLVGLGGPAVESDHWVEGVTITSDWTGTASVITLDITGHRNQFYNVNIQQPQAAAAAVTACRVSSYGNYFKNVHFCGMMTDTQDTGTASSSLEMYTYSGFSIFEDCIIGTSLYDTRSAVNGQILFSNTDISKLPQDILFKGCRILNRSATATNPAVYLKANNAMDRLLEFRDCTFYNFWVDPSDILTSGVIKDACGTSHLILLSGSTCQYGWTDWADVHTYVFAAMPTSSATGGTAIVTS